VGGAVSDAPKQQEARGVWRGCYSSLFLHPDFVVLSPDARMVFMALRLGSAATIAGLSRYFAAVLIAETGLKAEQVEAALEELATKPSRARPWIVRDGDLVWIRNALKFDPSVSLANAMQRRAVERVLETFPRSALAKKFRRYYNLPIASGEPPQNPSPGSAEPPDTLSQQKERSTNPKPKLTTTTTPKKGPGGPSLDPRSMNGHVSKGEEDPHTVEVNRRTEVIMAQQPGISRFDAMTQALAEMKRAKVTRRRR
jgi:hypothetical protein